MPTATHYTPDAQPFHPWRVGAFASVGTLWFYNRSVASDGCCGAKAHERNTEAQRHRETEQIKHASLLPPTAEIKTDLTVWHALSVPLCLCGFIFFLFFILPTKAGIHATVGQDTNANRKRVLRHPKQFEEPPLFGQVCCVVKLKEDWIKPRFWFHR